MRKTYRERIRELREDMEPRLNQKDIAEILHTSQKVYSRYETGAAKMPIHHLEALADFYGVSADYILGRTNERKPYPRD